MQSSASNLPVVVTGVPSPLPCILISAMQSVEKHGVQSRVTFGLFEADLATSELWKAGYRVKLQGLPFKVLKVLLENAGEVVSRSELQAGVWGPDVTVDFEHALSNAIKKLREALGDNADNPRFIETLSRRGFRFIAPVGYVSHPSPRGAEPQTIPAQTQSATMQDPSAAQPVAEAIVPAAAAPEPVSARRSKRNSYLLVASFSLGCLVAGSLVTWWSSRQHSSVPLRVTQITQEGAIYSPKVVLLGTLSAIATDGTHLFSPSNENGRVVLSQISISTAASQALSLPSQIGAPEMEGISPDGAQLLIRGNLGAASQQPLWIVPIDGGSAFRVPDVVTQAATWMPDGRSVLYASGNQLFTISLQNGRSTMLATTPGRAFWPRWSPDGKLLRFTIIDALNHTSSIWEMTPGHGSAHQILKAWSAAGSVCCGTWTGDGTAFVFEATRDGHTDLWRTNGSIDPTRITNGPLNFKAPVAGRDGGAIFFIGQDIHSRLERYDTQEKQYVPVQGFLSVADHVSYSRDSQWVAWVDPNGRLWRARNDGTERVLLTPPDMQVFMATWSPDDTRLAFMARRPTQPWQIYTLPSEGGNLERLLPDAKNIGDPSYSPDGKFIVFGTIPELMGQNDASRSLMVMELATHHVTVIPHSAGMYSPKWSPDGRYIAALTVDQKKLMLYDTKSTGWQTLTGIYTDHPVWSNDGKALYFHASFVEKKPIYRISISDGVLTEIADLSNFHVGSIALADFSGLTPDDVPLMHTQVSTGNLYALDLNQRP